MEQFNKVATLVGVFVIAVILQGFFIFLDCKNVPWKTAVEFTQAYHRLDPAMAELLCRQSLTKNDANQVEAYIRKASREAADRGRGLNYMKSIVYAIETHTRMIDSKTAEVKLHAKKRTAIHPIYALIGKFFFIGKTQIIDETLSLVKEDGKWKVCGNPFSLSEV